jgi:gamma-glutamyltranspeptidase/glutathione hydrolase
MKRRSFLQLASAGSISAVLGGSSSLFAAQLSREDRETMRIDRDMLRARNQNRSTVVCRNGVVCASQPLAGIVGVDILKGGGNAIDAAIAANAMLSLVEPMSCGPGGDLFAIVWIEKDQKLYGLNASGRAPYDWNIEEARKLALKAIPVYGPLSWSVPGCVSGWAELLKR